MTLAILFTFALDQFNLEFAKFLPPSSYPIDRTSSAPVDSEFYFPPAQDPKVASASKNARVCISKFTLFIFFLVIRTGSDFLMRFGVFVLAIFVGYMVVWKLPLI
jgi:hypothetical protein